MSATISFPCAIEDAETQITSAGYSIELWEPEFGWEASEAGAAEAPFPAQMLAALQAFQWFFTAASPCSWLHLAAEMQAGKTGVMNALIRLVLKNSRKLGIRPTSVFVLTGMSDNAWRKQTKERLPNAVGDNVEHNGSIARILTKLRMMATGGVLKNVLIIQDESHIASATGNKPCQLYRLIEELSPKADWVANGIRFLTVSATDPAKVIAMQGSGLPSRVIRLATAEGYQSVSALHTAGRVVDVSSFKGHLESQAALDFLRTTLETKYNDAPRYHLLRAAHGKTEAVHAKLAAAFPECEIRLYNADERMRAVSEGSTTSFEDINEILETPPEVHTFILIKNMFYASKTLDDEHVGILFDRSGGKDDTNLQSFLGRACGYGKSAHTIVVASLQTVKNYISLWRELCTNPQAAAKIIDVPAVEAKKLDRKMPHLRVLRAARATAVSVASAHADPHHGFGGAAAGGGGGGPEPATKKRTNPDDYRCEWFEFRTLAEAKAMGAFRPTPDGDFFLSCTTGAPHRVRADEVAALRAGKSTAALPPPKEVGQTVHRLYVAYSDTEDASTARFIVRKLTKIK